MGDPRFDYDRLRALLPERTDPWAGRPGPGAYGLFPLGFQYWRNSAHPVDANDGAVWQGRGNVVAFEAGGWATLGPLTLTVRPRAIYQQNRGFALVTPRDTVRSPFANPWHSLGGALRIDRPQRFGAEGFWTVEPGQSSLRADWRGWRAGVSTENRWWGPGRHNAIVLSNHAAGFPHAFVGTGRPVDIGIGTLAFTWLWGQVAESDWFDTVANNDKRFFTGATWHITPDGVPGLRVGATRAFVQYPPGEVLLIFQGLTKASQQDSLNPTGNDDRDQMLSLFFQWAFPESGFEVWGEWARNDHAQDLRDFQLQPEHSQAWTLGLQKVFARADGRVVRLGLETTRIERPTTFVDRPTPTYYTHHRVPQGYTHRGQVLGAALGPGGSGQVLDVDLWASWGRVGAFVRRQVHDNDAYYALRQRGELSFRNNDVEVTVGSSAVVFWGPFDLTAVLARGRQLNRYFLADNDETNLHAEFGVRWRIGS